MKSWNFLATLKWNPPSFFPFPYVSQAVTLAVNSQSGQPLHTHTHTSGSSALSLGCVKLFRVRQIVFKKKNITFSGISHKVCQIEYLKNRKRNVLVSKFLGLYVPLMHKLKKFENSINKF